MDLGQDMPFRQILYKSRLPQSMSDVERKAFLRSVLNTARLFNAENQITGLLLYCDGSLVQLLESDNTAALAGLIGRITRDTRHEDFEIVHDGQSDYRLCPTWSMGCASLKPDDLAELLDVPKVDLDESVTFALTPLGRRVKRLVLDLQHNPDIAQAYVA